MKKLLPFVVAALAASVALTGCSALKDSVTNRHELTFDDYSAAAATWTSMPSWIPTDATALRLRETTNAPVAVVAVTSSSDPVGCESTTREYLPGIGGDWEPTDYPHTILRCDDWEVMPTDTGWFGWTVSETDLGGTYAPTP